MKFSLTLPDLAQLITALSPIVIGGVVGVEHIIATIKAVRPEAEVDADLEQLIREATAAKADADRAAAGQDG